MIVTEQVEPFFSLFGDRDSIVETLGTAGVQGLPKSRAVEVLAWLNAPSTAARYVNLALAEDEALAASFHHWLGIYRRGGIVDPGADPVGGKALAFVVAANGIPVE